MAVMLKEEGQHMQWYQDELLHMAKDLGLRLLPAFNTSSGLPYPRVRSPSQPSNARTKPDTFPTYSPSSTQLYLPRLLFGLVPAFPISVLDMQQI